MESQCQCWWGIPRLFSLPMPRLLFFPDFFLRFFLPGGASQTFFLFPCPVYCSSWIFSPLPMDIRAMVLPDGCPHFHKAPTDPAHTVQQVVTLFTEGKPLFIKRIFRFDLRIKLSDIFIHIVKIGGVRHILCQTPPAYSLFHTFLLFDPRKPGHQIRENPGSLSVSSTLFSGSDLNLYHAACRKLYGKISCFRDPVIRETLFLHAVRLIEGIMRCHGSCQDPRLYL